MQNDDAYADRVVREAMLAASGGLDADKIAEAVAKIVDAVDKQAEALKQADYKPADYERIARAMAPLDEVGRRALPAGGVRRRPAGFQIRQGNGLAAGAHQRAAADRAGLD